MIDHSILLALLPKHGLNSSILIHPNRLVQIPSFLARTIAVAHCLFSALMFLPPLKSVLYMEVIVVIWKLLLNKYLLTTHDSLGCFRTWRYTRDQNRPVFEPVFLWINIPNLAPILTLKKWTTGLKIFLPRNHGLKLIPMQSTKAFQKNCMHHRWMGLKIKLHDLLSLVNNTLLTFGTVSLMKGI